MMTTRTASARRLVVKVGSALVTNNGEGLDLAAINDWARQIAALHAAGKQVILVSSGAIACGLQRLGWHKRPRAVHELQAAAAVGQMGLVQVYESAFAGYGLHTAQILLTHDDLADRKRYLNARSTLLTLLQLGVVPIINENDTVVTDEIKFGDNDTLGSLVANLVDADALIILTDQSGLFTADPRKDPQARLLSQEATAGDATLEAMAGGAGTLDRQGRHDHQGARGQAGGQQRCAHRGRLRTRPTSWCAWRGAKPSAPCFIAMTPPLAARKQWLADHLQLRGKLTLDAAPSKALSEDGKSLLPIGVLEVQRRVRARCRGRLCLRRWARGCPGSGQLRQQRFATHCPPRQPGDRRDSRLHRRAGDHPPRQPDSHLAAVRIATGDAWSVRGLGERLIDKSGERDRDIIRQTRKLDAVEKFPELVHAHRADMRIDGRQELDLADVHAKLDRQQITLVSQPGFARQHGTTDAEVGQQTGSAHRPDVVRQGNRTDDFHRHPGARAHHQASHLRRVAQMHVRKGHAGGAQDTGREGIGVLPGKETDDISLPFAHQAELALHFRHGEQNGPAFEIANQLDVIPVFCRRDLGLDLQGIADRELDFLEWHQSLAGRSARCTTAGITSIWRHGLPLSSLK
jgi:glutamate 5-kinase